MAFVVASRREVRGQGEVYPWRVRCVFKNSLMTNWGLKVDPSTKRAAIVCAEDKESMGSLRATRMELNSLIGIGPQSGTLFEAGGMPLSSMGGYTTGGGCLQVSGW